MSWSYVQGSGAAAPGSVSSITATFPGTVTPGDVICAAASGYYSILPIVCTDNKGNVYTQDIQYTSAQGYTVSLYHCVVTTGGSSLTLTFTPASPASMAVSIDEFIPPAGALSVDSTSSNGCGGTTSTAATAGSLAVTGNDLIYAALNTIYYSGTFTSGSGLTSTYSNTNGAGSAFEIATEYALNQTTAINPGITLSPAGYWYMAAVAISGSSSSFQPWIYGDQYQEMWG